MSNVIINDSHLTNIASAIRSKNGTSTKYKPGEMAEAINDITASEDLSSELTTQNNLLTAQETTIDDIKLALQNKSAGSGEEVVLQEKTITPSTSQQNVIADTGYNGLSKVVVSPVTSAIDSDIKATNIRKGINILGVTGTLEESVAEDLTNEFNDYENLLTTQETTIDDIMTALQGKTAGGGSSNVVSGSFIPTENYISSDQYFEVDLGFRPSEVIVYRKSWVKGTASINVAFRSDYMGVSVTNTASSSKANEKMVGSSYITITATGFKVTGNSTYYLIGGAEYIYVAVKEVGVV